MNYLILDTETSGLFDFKKPADAPGQPRLASIAMILADENLHVMEGFTRLIKPNGWVITPEVAAINGLSTERCAAEGVDVGEALEYYTRHVDQGFVVVAFNCQYDSKVLRGELRRAGLPDRFETTPNICTMRAASKVGIQKAGPKQTGYPKLSDAFRHFTGNEMVGGHSALIDAHACLDIMRGLRDAGALPEPTIAYAKQRPGPIPAPAPEPALAPTASGVSWDT